MKKLMLAPLLVLVGCGNQVAATDGGPDPMASPLAIACTDATGDLFTLPAGMPAFDPTHRGDVFRCAFDTHVSAADANTALEALGYVGPPVTRSMEVYRIAYVTQRGGTTAEGYSSARVFLPDGARPEAFVVTAHGTRGEASSCANARRDLLDPTFTESSKIYNLALAGNGWTVISPDLSGYGYGQAPHGWFLAEDEAHAVLDATRAMKNLLPPAALPPKVVLMGHSQGSHAVLSAQSFARSYGMEGELVGVVPMALLWLSGQSWGASITTLAGLTTQHDAGAVSYGMFYFYGHGELYDGAGGGMTMFQAAKRDQVKAMLDSTCEDDMGTALPPLGATPSDFYDPAFVNAMQDCEILQTNCDLEPAKTWKARALADRPAIDPSSAPIVIWHGAIDTDIVPARAQCGFDKLARDLAAVAQPTTSLTICGDPDADHTGVVQRDIDWVARWIDARVTGNDPPDCLGTAPLQPPGGTLTCATPPSND
jgi:pimeloyl-ACP methyl ester carboxylesterase